MTTDDIAVKIMEMTNSDDLLKIQSVCTHRIRILAHEIHFVPGVTKVRLKPRFQTKDPFSSIGTVKKVNGKTIKVVFEGYLSVWNVDKTIVDIVS